MTDTVTRPISIRDLPAMAAIERDSFGVPWSTGMLALEVERPGSLGFVAERDGTPVGFAICSFDGSDWTLLRIAVRPGERRAGLASELLARLLDAMPGPPRVTLEVRESNLPAIRFYEHHGFLVAGRRRGYYADTGEDALIMWRTPGTLAGTLDDVPDPEAPGR